MTGQQRRHSSPDSVSADFGASIRQVFRGFTTWQIRRSAKALIHIAALRSKDDRVKLLAEKQAAMKQAKALEEAAKNAAPQTDLSGLTVAQLKDMAKQHGVSLNLAKSDVIEMRAALEPHIDHYSYAGKPSSPPSRSGAFRR